MVASLSRAVIDEARARAIIVQSVTWITIGVGDADIGRGLKLKPGLMPYDLTPVINDKFLESPL
ncbi:MAG: hypothetical protein BMS9Abin28_0048 [Anaerolineae bacterium]|nr:MAG: hypothetical protein BMS9Abin28_0048 [Anaerolineae bacterium]